VPQALGLGEANAAEAPKGADFTFVQTVVSADKELRFKSQALDTNDTFSFVFDKPGTYKYFCSVHSHMVGTIVVK
jgi:plastocyanin